MVLQRLSELQGHPLPTHERLALIIIRNAIIRDPDLFAVSGTVLRSLDGTIASLP